MALHLTPEILEGAYNFLCACPPFSRWVLPPGDEVEFHVRKLRGEFARCELLHNGQFVIAFDQDSTGHLASVLAPMAHEMIHVHVISRGIKELHGPDFQRAAKQVCRLHGFDPKAF